MFAPNLQSVRLLQAAVHPLSGIKGDFDSLIDLAGDALFVSSAKHLMELTISIPLAPRSPGA